MRFIILPPFQILLSPHGEIMQSQIELDFPWTVRTACPSQEGTLQSTALRSPSWGSIQAPLWLKMYPGFLLFQKAIHRNEDVHQKDT